MTLDKLIKSDKPQALTVKGKNTLMVKDLLVCSPEIANPVAVRHAWENNPVSTLYNGGGMPASPFRTDDWK